MPRTLKAHAMKQLRDSDAVHPNLVTIDEIYASKTTNISLINRVKKNLNWQTISQKWALSVEFINAFSEYLNWPLICHNKNLPLKTLETFFDKFNHGVLLENYPNLPLSFIKKIDIDMFAEDLSNFEDLDLQYIIDNKDKLDWKILCEYQKFPDWFMLEYHDRLHWDDIWLYQTIAESFVEIVNEKYPEHIDWSVILDAQRLSETCLTKIGPAQLASIDALWANQILSEKFIEDWAFPSSATSRRARDQWETIAKYQKLSEPFIRQHIDIIELAIICEHQNLSVDFINAYRGAIEFDWLSQNRKLSIDIVREFKDRLNWHYLTLYWDKIFDFIDEFAEYVDWQAFTDRVVPEHILQKYITHFNMWETTIGNQILSDSFIRANINTIGLDNIVTYCTHDIDQLLIDFQDQVNWRLAWEHQSLKLETIIKVQQHITDRDWDMISGRQALSETFILKNINKPFNWQKICKFQVLSEQFLERFFIEPIDPLIVQAIGIHQNLSEKFIRKHAILQDVPEIEIYQVECISQEFASVLANRARFRNRNAWPPRRL